MKLQLKPIVSSIVLALSGQAFAGHFEIVPQSESADITKSKPVTERKNIRLNAGEFDPLYERIQINSVVTKSQKNSKYGLVQLYENNSKNQKLLTQLGADIVGYLPEDTFVVRWNSQIKSQIQKSSSFRFAGDYQAAFKVSPNLLKQNKSLKGGSDHVMTIDLFGFRGGSVERLKNQIYKAIPSANISEAKTVQGTPYIKLDLAQEVQSNIMNLIQSDDVMWVDKHRQNQLMNIDSVGPIQANEAEITQTPIWNQGIIGTGQIVAVADSGLDRNQDFFSQWSSGTGSVVKKYTDASTPPVGEVGQINADHKVVAYYIQPGATSYDDDESCGEDGTPSGFHGTHVAGTVAGDAGTPANSSSANYDEGDGMAPHAQILFQDIGNTQTGCLTADDKLYEMFLQAAKGGAGISNNSYGFVIDEGEEDGYFFTDFQADLASYEIEDLLIVTSAGNDGNQGLGHFAQAKNVLAVGALGHGDSTTTASFSSRGYAFDGRVKPDIVAPGSGIVSAAGNLDNAVPPTQDVSAVKPLSGTSMAAPTVSGGAALMRQYFMDGFYPSGVKNTADQMKPSGSLLKSTLLNGTLLRTRTPSIDQGWGRIWLDNNLYFTGDSKALRVWDLPNSSGIQTGDEMKFEVNVPAGEAFRATLTWFDPPALFTTGQALVNDLDLEVRFNGSVYKGNNLSSSVSQEGGSADDVNNVEQIHLPDPSPGVYEVIVKGSSVNGYGTLQTQRQGFALVTSQAQCASAVNGAPGISLSETSRFEPTVNVDSLTGINDYQVYRKVGGCAAPNSSYDFVGQINSATGMSPFIDESTVNGVTYGYAVKGVDACGEGVYSSCQEVVSNALCQSVPQFNSNALQVANSSGGACGVTLQWPTGNNTCSTDVDLKYNIYRSDEVGFTASDSNMLASGVLNNSYVDFTVNNNQSYNYIITAVDENGNESFNQNSKGIFTTGDQFVPGDYIDDPDTTTQAALEAPWQLSTAKSSTGSTSFHNAEDGQSYDPNVCAFVTLPEIELQSGQPVLSYDVAYQIEEFWDGVVVQISTNGGSTWLDLPPEDGYPSDFRETAPEGTPINACGFPTSQGAFNGSQTSFTSQTSDLSAYAGEKVIVRWAFSSDQGAEEEGFYLDNIKITAASAPGTCEVTTVNQLTSGPWFNPEQSGHGFFMEVSPGDINSPDRLTSYWYTYLDGEPKWIFGTGPIEGNQVTLNMLTTEGGISPPNYDPADLDVLPWGSLTFDFQDQNNALINWESTINGYGNGELPITRLANLSASSDACLSGSFSNPNQPGHGFVTEVVGSPGAEVLLISWYSYDNSGNQIWLLGQGSLIDNKATVQVGVFNGADFPPNFNSGDVFNQIWGTLEVEFTDPNTMLIDWEAELPGFTNGQIEVNRFTQIKGKGCL